MALKALPRLEPGLVVHYEYTWRDPSRGRLSGDKARPCLAVPLPLQAGATLQRVLHFPITHSNPVPPTQGVLVPAHVRAVAGLDAAEGWIVTNECNLDHWPQGITRIPRSTEGAFDYGLLPPGFFATVKASILSHQAAGSLRSVPRS